MNRMTYKDIEDWVDNVEELYWWGKDYCRANRCNVRQFIKDNYEDVMMIIKKNQKGLCSAN